MLRLLGPIGPPIKPHCLQHELGLATELHTLRSAATLRVRALGLNCKRPSLLVQARFTALNIHVAYELAAVQLLLALEPTEDLAAWMFPTAYLLSYQARESDLECRLDCG